MRAKQVHGVAPEPCRYPGCDRYPSKKWHKCCTGLGHAEAYITMVAAVVEQEQEGAAPPPSLFDAGDGVS